MRRALSLGQWLVTLLLCLFLIVPVVLSMAVGLTRNYIRGFKSGWTFDWVAQVWETYHTSIWM
ncbi:MAG: ABC transporter permease, partial [Ralstonia sp.]